MIDAVNASGVQAPTTSAVDRNGDLGKEEFLKLLVAQLQHQDPLKPTDNTQFIAELAQFSSLEQTIGINDRLDMLTAQQQGLANTEVVGLVGKVATVSGSAMTYDGSAQGVRSQFTLGGAAAKVTVSIVDATGTVVRQDELPAQRSGDVTYTWSGMSDANVRQPPGTYSVRVDARNSEDQPVSVSQTTTASVEAVTFSGGAANVQLSNGIAVPVSDLIRVESANP